MNKITIVKMDAIMVGVSISVTKGVKTGIINYVNDTNGCLVYIVESLKTNNIST